MKSQITSCIDQAVNSSDDLLALIKDYKKYLMRQFLGIDGTSSDAVRYKSGFVSCGYKIVKLRDVVQPEGITAVPNDKNFINDLYDSSGYPLIEPRYINSLRFRPEKFRYVSRDAGRDHPYYIVKGGDIILSYKNDDPGASALIPFMQEDSFLGTDLLRIRPDHSLCEVFYILNILHFYYHTDILNIISSEHGGLTVDAVSDMIVPLPSIKDQKEISHKMLQLSAGMEAQEHYHKEMLNLSLLINNL